MLSSVASADTLTVKSSTAEVVAWNLAGFNAIPDAKVREQAKAIELLDAEVVALVEVNPDSVAADLVTRLNNTGLCYGHQILAQSARQNIAILHKCSVQVTNPRLVPNSDDGNTGLRKALAADLKVGEFDFLLIVVHMKAGRQSSAHATRDRQARAIASFIQSETNGAEKDVLLVGDYNMIPGQDTSNFHEFSPNGFLSFISSWDLREGLSHISTSSPGNLLDGYAITASHTSEYLAGSLEVVAIHRVLGMSLSRFRERVSDHLPIMARFRITRDDD